jgi:hypothetical protein
MARRVPLVVSAVAVVAGSLVLASNPAGTTSLTAIPDGVALVADLRPPEQGSRATRSKKAHLRPRGPRLRPGTGTRSSSPGRRAPPVRA